MFGSIPLQCAAGRCIPGASAEIFAFPRFRASRVRFPSDPLRPSVTADATGSAAALGVFADFRPPRVEVVIYRDCTAVRLPYAWYRSAPIYWKISHGFVWSITALYRWPYTANSAYQNVPFAFSRKNFTVCWGPGKLSRALRFWTLVRSWDCRPPGTRASGRRKKNSLSRCSPNRRSSFPLCRRVGRRVASRSTAARPPPVSREFRLYFSAIFPIRDRDPLVSDQFAQDIFFIFWIL